MELTLMQVNRSELQALRDAVTASYGFRGADDKVVSGAAVETMDSKKRKKLRWRADPAMISRLVEAEQQETERIFKAMGY